ncbi:MAG: PCRF domain-containing protein [Patescibacteria group bacterium]|nr:PCRF domain-containing protein [Patescibacteria group bacterium]MCL5432150.1 PCRF domain-containing protein [Patescibacteria group bacterium]
MDYLENLIADLDQKIAQAKQLAQDPEMAEMAQEEIKKLEEEKSALVKPAASPEQSLNSRDIIIEIRGAAGGEEAKLWGQDLLRTYSRFAQAQGWRVTPEGPLAIKISGRGVYGKLKYESGVHRVQRVPVTESSGRVHTSTATVAVLPELEDVDIHIDPADIQEDFYRSGGHGGQNVNKVSSAVRLTHKPSGLVVTCQEERDQPKNRAKAMEKLRQLLWEAEQNRQLAEMSADRRAQVGTGMRNEKIRTYNFLQDRVTDHRLDQNFHNLEKIMEGDLEEIIKSLTDKFGAI